MRRLEDGVARGRAFVSLVGRQTAVAWDLRRRIWSGEEVLLLAPDADVPRLRGFVVGVSPTDSVVWFDDARWDEPVVVDLSLVVSVRLPHFHEDGPAPKRSREVFEARKGDEPIPGQLRFGADRVPEVSPRSEMAMQKAAGALLSQPLLDVLAALDGAARGKASVPTRDVAEALGDSVQATVRRLAFLAELGLVYVEEGRLYRWSPAD